MDQLDNYFLIEEIKTDDNFLEQIIIHIELPLWAIYFDGSKITVGVGISILIISLENEMITFSLRLDFHVLTIW